jgi:hypothetical protein
VVDRQGDGEAGPRVALLVVALYADALTPLQFRLPIHHGGRPPTPRFDGACGCLGHDDADRLLKEQERSGAAENQTCLASPLKRPVGPALMLVYSCAK